MLQFFVLSIIYLTAGAVVGTYLPGFWLAYLTGLSSWVGLCWLADWCSLFVRVAHDWNCRTLNNNKKNNGGQMYMQQHSGLIARTLLNG